MFFRRERPKQETFADRMNRLRQAGFEVSPSASGAEVSRGACAVTIEERQGAVRLAGRAGVKFAGETAFLVDGGFQKFFRTPSGKTRPAQAEDLRALHAFEEDLKEALGLESLYNESLGTVSTFYRYDRVAGREP